MYEQVSRSTLHCLFNCLVLCCSVLLSTWRTYITRLSLFISSKYCTHLPRIMVPTIANGKRVRKSTQRSVWQQSEGHLNYCNVVGWLAGWVVGWSVRWFTDWLTVCVSTRCHHNNHCFTRMDVQSRAGQKLIQWKPNNTTQTLNNCSAQ